MATRSSGSGATLSSSDVHASEPNGLDSSSSSSSFASNFIRDLIVPQAAAISTVLTKSILHPIDTIKIRVQAQRHQQYHHSDFAAKNSGLTTRVANIRSFYNSYKGQWSIAHVYAGLPIKLLLYAPYQSMYMTTYMWSKPLLYGLGLSAPAEKDTIVSRMPSRDEKGLASSVAYSPLESSGDAPLPSPLDLSPSAKAQALVGTHTREGGAVVKQNKALEAVVGAVIAEFTCAFIRVPMEVMKVRLQASVTRNTATAARDLFWRQGLSKVCRLFVPQTLCHDLPYSITQWLVYEHLRPVLDRKAKEWERELLPLNASSSSSSSSSPSSDSYNGRIHWWLVKAATFLVGASSGLAAGIVTVPLDNVKTRVIVESNAAPRGQVPSFIETGRAVVRREGVRGLLRGGAWRVLWITTNTACFFPIFDCVKEMLALRDEEMAALAKKKNH